MLLFALPLVAATFFQVKVESNLSYKKDTTKISAKGDTARKIEGRVGISISGGNNVEDEDRKPIKRVPVTDEMRRTAFKDPVARDLLLRARKARMVQDSLLISYQARAYQRFSVGMGLRAFGRDRLLMRHENVTQVSWHKDRGAWVDVKGARTALPVSKEGERESNADIVSDPPLPYYPGRDELWIGSDLAKAEVDERELVHPIAEGSEAYYTYESGDSVIMVLPDQRRITLREIRVEARAPKWNLAVGSFWFDQSSAHLVRAVYRLSVPIDIWAMDETKNDMKEVPFFVKPLISPLKVGVDAISIEYGLYNQRFWMPKLQVLEAGAQVSAMRVPVQFEQRFRYDGVNGLDSVPAFPYQPRRSATYRDSLKKAGVDSLKRDTLMKAFWEQRRVDDSTRKVAECAKGGTYTTMHSRYNGTLNVAVAMPCDTAKLTHSSEFTGSLYAEGESVFGTGDIEELKKALNFNLQAGWMPQMPHIDWGLGETRYNRVEGLSTGARVSMLLGRGYTVLTGARVALAAKQLDGDLSLERTNGRATVRGTVYRRLALASDFGNPLSFGAGLASLLYAGDEGFYYRTWGGELSGEAKVLGRAQWRLFAEQQWNAPVATHFSLFRGAHDDRFAPNITGQQAWEYGAAVRLQQQLGEDPHGFRLSADWRGEGATGDFDYGRGLLDLTVSHGLWGATSMALTASAGTTAGTAPAQRGFQLGGFQTVRGQAPGTMTGNAYWMGRAEYAIDGGAVKPVIFGDIGWAGDRTKFTQVGRVMSGVGVGASILDGMIRFDVARGLWPAKGVRVNLGVEARF